MQWREQPLLGLLHHCRRVGTFFHFNRKLRNQSGIREVTGLELTGEDDGVETGLAPQLHEVHHVPEPQRRVSGENHAGLPELAAEVAVDTGVVFQLVGLDQLNKSQVKSVSLILVM